MDAIVYDKVGKEAEKVREALYGIYPQATITDAAIASFDDGADGIPVKALTVGVEPMQDLHGYENPWPAGGGKNLIPFPYLSQEGTFSGVTVTVDDLGVITMNGTATAAVYFNLVANNTGIPMTAGDYILHRPAASGINGLNITAVKNGSYWNSAGSNNVSLNLSEDANIAFYIQVSNGTTLSNVKIYPMFEKGTAASEWSPYSNICPISGWTGAEIQQTGDFACRLPNETRTEAGITVTTNSANIARIEGTATSRAGIAIATFTAEDTNVFVSDVVVADSSFNWFIWDATARQKISADLADINGQYTLTIGHTYSLAFYPYAGNSYNFITRATITKQDTGNQISVTFPSEAGTVYGGEDEVISGKLINRTKKVVAKNMIWGQHNSGVFYFLVRDKENTNANRLWCDTFKVHDGNAAGVSQAASILSNFECIASAGSQNPYVYILTPDETIEAFLENYGDTEFIYELAEPTEYTLTPQTLPTLYGTNNIWANTGNIEKLTYRADLGKYIDSHITTAVANALNA